MRADRIRQLSQMGLHELRQVLVMDLKRIPISRMKRKLQSYRYYQLRIDSNLDQIRVLRSRMQKVTVAYHDAPGGGTGKDASELIAKMLELETYIKADTERVRYALMDIQFLIDSLDNMLERQILDIRYVRGWRNWYRIAEEVHYSAIHVKRTHGIALKKLVPLVEEILLKKER